MNKAISKENERLSYNALPHSLEAEQAVLGSMLGDNDIAFTISSMLSESDFYSPANRIIYSAIVNLINRNIPVDFVTVTDELSSSGKLEAVGSVDYITLISTYLPSTINYEYYTDIVKRDSIRRRLIQAGQNIIKQTRENDDAASVLSYAEKQVFDISSDESKSDLESIAGATDEVIKNLDEIAKNGGAIQGIPTGLKDLDALLGGFHKTDLILLAARPGVGKTSLAMNFVLNAAINHKKHCAVFSLEMPTTQIAQRAIFSVAGVDMKKGLSGKLNSEELKKVWSAKSLVSNAPIYIDASSLTTPTDILSKCRKLKREKGLDLIMVDYLQLMSSGEKQKENNRQLEIASMTRFLKICAKELEVPVILLSQLSRGTEQRKDHKPMASDLRDSGAIEQDADIIMFIYKPDMYEDTINKFGPGICELLVTKHRNGPCGDIQMRWIGEYTKFVDVDEKIVAPKANVAKNDDEEFILEKIETNENEDDIW